MRSMLRVLGMYNFDQRLETPQPTLKSLIEEHARLNFSDFHSTLLVIFHEVKEKIHPAHLLIYFNVNMLTGLHFFQPCSFIPICSSIRDFRVFNRRDY